MNTHQGSEANHITDIIQVMNSGIDFYQKAQEKVEDPAIGALFQRMIDARKVSVERLQPYAINEKGEREDGSSFAVEARRAYTALLTTFSSHNDSTYVKELEEVEEAPVAKKELLENQAEIIPINRKKKQIDLLNIFQN